MTLREKEGYYLPVDIEGLTENLKVKAKVELNESEEKIRDGLQILRELIKEKKLPICPDDDFLLMFLRAKKFNMKNVIDQVKNYSYQRHFLMNYYGFMFADKIMPVLRSNICGILPKRDHEGRVITYFIARNYDPSICDPDDVLRAAQSVGHFILSFPATQVCGIALIADLKVDSLQTIQMLYKYVKFILPNLHTFPGRFQKVDCINTHVFVRTLVAISRPIIPMKLLKRTDFHSDGEKVLHKTYDPSILPAEFGGTLGSIKEISEKYLQKFEDYLPKLQASNRYFKRKNTVPFPET